MVTKTLFQCPNCKEPLNKGQKQYFCPNGHSFDIAKQGYVNLLLSSHIGAGKPGDSKEMIKSRREFLDKGYYQEFSDTLNNIVVETLKAEQSDNISIFDAGCGEGYYVSRLKQQFSAFDNSKNLDMYGIDVSKSAIQYATGRDKDIRFAVASSYHIPLLISSVDFILCIFAPRDEQEFKRILKPSGKLLVAAPGPKHLYSLRKFLYDSPDVIGQKGTLEEGFNLLEHKMVSYSITTNKEDIFNLFNMTPYSRHADEESENKLKTIGEFSTEIDINIRVYQKA